MIDQSCRISWDRSGLRCPGKFQICLLFFILVSEWLTAYRRSEVGVRQKQLQNIVHTSDTTTRHDISPSTPLGLADQRSSSLSLAGYIFFCCWPCSCASRTTCQALSFSSFKPTIYQFFFAPIPPSIAGQLPVSYILTSPPPHHQTPLSMK